MEVIPERLGTDFELTRDVDWALPVGEVPEHLMLLLRQWVRRARPPTASSRPNPNSASALAFHERISPPSVTASAASAVCSKRSKRSRSSMAIPGVEVLKYTAEQLEASPAHPPDVFSRSGAGSRDNHPIVSNRWTIAREPQHR
jgi:hypothetical protein